MYVELLKEQSRLEKYQRCVPLPLSAKKYRRGSADWGDLTFWESTVNSPSTRRNGVNAARDRSSRTVRVWCCIESLEKARKKKQSLLSKFRWRRFCLGSGSDGPTQLRLGHHTPRSLVSPAHKLTCSLKCFRKYTIYPGCIKCSRSSTYHRRKNSVR